MTGMVDRGALEPPYQQIAGILRARIESGDLEPGARLPSVEQLVGEYGVARITARKALRVLVDEGLAVMQPGWGTFVAKRQR